VLSQQATLECAKLLGAMELDVEEDPEHGMEAELKLINKEDKETC